MIAKLRRWWRGGPGGGGWGSGSKAGRLGERIAARDLHRRGHRILARNIATPMGEIDLIARAPDRHTLVFIEVKTSDRHHDGLRPEVRVTPAKQRRLVALAADFARRHGYADHPLRFDVVAVVLQGEGGKPQVRHHIGAFASHV